MPLQVTYVLDKGVLPVDYRRGFASLLKEAIKQANPVCYERFYSRVHVLKPFTLSVFFPGLKGHENNHFTVGSKAILYFATSSTEICTAVCNGILYKRKFPLFENTALLQNVFLKPRIMITQKKMMFKTMSPVLVSTKGNPDWYLLPGDEGFREGLGVAVREVCRAFLDLPEGKVEFEPISIRRKIVRHYNMNMQGFTGIFELQGDPQVLNLIYQVGLGVRRSRGFGMLEVVQTASREISSTEESVHK